MKQLDCLRDRERPRETERFGVRQSRLRPYPGGPSASAASGAIVFQLWHRSPKIVCQLDHLEPLGRDHAVWIDISDITLFQSLSVSLFALLLKQSKRLVAHDTEMVEHSEDMVGVMSWRFMTNDKWIINDISVISIVGLLVELCSMSSCRVICANHIYCVTLDHALMVGSTLYRQEMILFDSMICMHPWHLRIIELFGDSLWRCRFLGGASCGSSPHLRCFDVFRYTRSLEVRKFESSRCTWALCCQKAPAPWPHGPMAQAETLTEYWAVSWCFMMVVMCCHDACCMLFQHVSTFHSFDAFSAISWWLRWFVLSNNSTSLSQLVTFLKALGQDKDDFSSWTSDQFPTQCPK